MTPAPQPSRAYEITKCQQCPHEMTRQIFYGAHYRYTSNCLKHDQQKTIPRRIWIGSIPTWCPLPAMPEVKS